MKEPQKKDPESSEKRVTGIGGIFFKAKDPEKLMSWYTAHLGLKPESQGLSTSMFFWREKDDEKQIGYTVWAIFPHNTDYFDPSKSSFMINFRVNDLDGLLNRLKQEGIKVDEKREEYEYGKFGWITDPEGNRIELWEPKGQPPARS